MEGAGGRGDGGVAGAGEEDPGHPSRDIPRSHTPYLPAQIEAKKEEPAAAAPAVEAKKTEEAPVEAKKEEVKL